MNRAEELMRSVQAKSFLAHDILLYLDTHPEDREAFRAYQRALKEQQEAERVYEQRVMALTAEGQYGKGAFDWTDEPFPWQ